MSLPHLRLRSQVVKRMRQFFDERGYLEVQTPRLVGLPGQEPYLEPMWSSVREQGGAAYKAALISSPEYAMKRLLGSDLDKIYDLGPCFRNEEPWDGTHDPEFLMLEWYRKQIGIQTLMDEAEELVRFVSSQVEAPQAPYVPIGPFRRLTVSEAMKLYADIDLLPLLGDREKMSEVCRLHEQSVQETDTWDDLFFKLFLSEVEPYLGWNQDHSKCQPTFLWNYPLSMAALAKANSIDERFALRAELYIGDLELSDGFAELTDSVEQRKRFQEEQALRRSLGKETWPVDERFMEALPRMGNAAGMAFGVDRLVMLLAGTDSISDVMPIPVRKRF